MFAHGILLFCAFGANALDDVLHILHVKSVGKNNQRDGVVLQTISLSALSAGKMHMIEVLTVLATAHAVFPYA